MAREKLKVLDGTYGNAETPCDVLMYAHSVVGTWYCVEGSSMAHLTHADLEYIEDEYGVVNVEILHDVECFTWNRPIETLEQLEEAVNA